MCWGIVLMAGKFCNGCNDFIRSKNWCTQHGKFTTAWTDRCSEQAAKLLQLASIKGELK